MKIQLCVFCKEHITPVLAILTRTITESNTPDLCQRSILVELAVLFFTFLTSKTYIYESIVLIVTLAVVIQVSGEYRLACSSIVNIGVSTSHSSRITTFDDYALCDTPLIGSSIRCILTFHQIELVAYFCFRNSSAQVFTSSCILPRRAVSIAISLWREEILCLCIGTEAYS